MPKLTCPVDGCDWQSQALDAALAEALTTALKVYDKTEHKGTPALKVKLDPPQIGAACDPDQWSAFTRQRDRFAH